MTHLLDYLADRVLLCDGAIGTEVQGRALDIERDFHGHENCTDILCESRPDLVREILRSYLAAGCDAVQTNSFGGSPITLGEFGIADKAFDLNRRAAELAQEAVAEFAHDGKTRFGSNVPGSSPAASMRSASRPARTRCRSRPRSTAPSAPAPTPANRPTSFRSSSRSPSKPPAPCWS